MTRIRPAPVTRCQVWRPLVRTVQDEQLLLEQKMLRDHRAHATGATQRRCHEENWEFETHRVIGGSRGHIAAEFGVHDDQKFDPLENDVDLRRAFNGPRIVCPVLPRSPARILACASAGGVNPGFSERIGNSRRTGCSPVSWGSIDEPFVNLTMPSKIRLSACSPHRPHDDRSQRMRTPNRVEVGT